MSHSKTHSYLGIVIRIASPAFSSSIPIIMADQTEVISRFEGHCKVLILMLMPRYVW